MRGTCRQFGQAWGRIRAMYPDGLDIVGTPLEQEANIPGVTQAEVAAASGDVARNRGW